MSLSLGFGEKLESLAFFPSLLQNGLGRSSPKRSLVFKFELPGWVPLPVSGSHPPCAIILVLPLWGRSFFQSFSAALWEGSGQGPGALRGPIWELLGSFLGAIFKLFSDILEKWKLCSRLSGSLIFTPARTFRTISFCVVFFSALQKKYVCICFGAEM